MSAIGTTRPTDLTIRLSAKESLAEIEAIPSPKYKTPPGAQPSRAGSFGNIYLSLLIRARCLTSRPSRSADLEGYAVDAGLPRGL
jgi:hypothetical protein